MEDEILQTKDQEDWDLGCEQVISGGIWLRNYYDSGKLKATIYCRDKVKLSDFSDRFGLKNLKVDVSLYGKGYYLDVYTIVVWGKKLEEIKKHI